MNADARKRGLGRGLDALFRDVREEEESFAPKIKRTDEMVAAALQLQENTARAESGATVLRIDGARSLPVEKLSPGRFQPRRAFDDAALNELAESIKKMGVLQPLLVRPRADALEAYEIIAGERRWRAAQRAQIHEVPVIIRMLSDREALEIGLIENLQRTDLTPMEEAEGYQRLMNEFEHTQETLATQLGKSRSHIANTLRLLKLPFSVRTLVQKGNLSAGHARALIGLEDAESLAEKIVAQGLSVRQVEKMTQGDGASSSKKSKKPQGIIKKDVDTLALERELTTLLGLTVTIHGDGPQGILSIAYGTLGQLDDVIRRLSGRDY